MLQWHRWLRDKILSKISILVYLSSATVFAYKLLLWIYHEHVECMNVLNEWFASTVYIMYILLCICVFVCFKFNAFLYMYYVHGAQFLRLIDVVASSPSSKGCKHDTSLTVSNSFEYLYTQWISSCCWLYEIYKHSHRYSFSKEFINTLADIVSLIVYIHSVSHSFHSSFY